MKKILVLVFLLLSFQSVCQLLPSAPAVGDSAKLQSRTLHFDGRFLTTSIVGHPWYRQPSRRSISFDDKAIGNTNKGNGDAASFQLNAAAVQSKAKAGIEVAQFIFPFLHPRKNVSVEKSQMSWDLKLPLNYTTYVYSPEWLRTDRFSAGFEVLDETSERVRSIPGADGRPNRALGVAGFARWQIRPRTFDPGDLPDRVTPQPIKKR